MIKIILKAAKASFIAMQDIYLSSSSKIGLSSPDAMVGKTACNPISSQERKKQNCSKERLRATKMMSAKGFSNFAIHFLNCMQFLMKQLLHTIELQSLLFRERS